MKLYTEEQVHKAYDAGMQFIGEDKGSPIEFFSSLTPIELPSDEEIENRIKTHNPYPKQKQMHIDWSNGFERGAKWVIEQIKSE